MLINRDHYFYISSTNDTNFSAIPTGRLNVERVLANKPCWQTTSGSIKPEKKTLLIPPLRLSYTYHKILTRRLINLVQEGFRVYVVHPNYMIEPFNNELPNNNPVIYPDEFIIKDAILELNLVHDELLLLTSNELNLLIEGDDNDWLDLPSFKDANLKNSCINGASLRRFLLEKGDEIEHLNLSGCLNLEDASLEGLALPKLKSLTLYDERWSESNLSVTNINCILNSARTTLEQIRLTQVDVNELVDALAAINSIKSLEFHQCSNVNRNINRLNVAALEELSLKNNKDLSGHILGKLLAETQCLKILRIDGLDGVLGEEIQTLNLTSLEILDLDSVGINEKTLTNILVSAAALKEIRIISCDNFLPDMLLPLNFASLQSLVLRNYSDMNSELFKKIEEAVHLKTFNFYGRLEENERDSFSHMIASLENIIDLTIDVGEEPEDRIPLKFPESNLKLLESLTLENVAITGKDLGNLLANNTCLKYLYLSLGEMNDEPFAPLPLYSLKTLKISQYSIKGESLGNLLANTKELKELTLCSSLEQEDMEEYIYDIKKEFGVLPEKLSLGKLESLDLHDSYIDCLNLNTLLANTNILKTLDLTDCDNLDICRDYEEDDPDFHFSQITFNLSLLENINLTNSNLHTDHLGHLLTNTPNLKKLNLHNWKNWASPFCTFHTHKTFHLSLLQSLDLSNSFVTSKSVSQLLEYTFTLKELKLKNCDSIRAEIDRTLRLDSLKVLELKNMNWDTLALHQILSQTQQLRSLDLSGCEELETEDGEIKDLKLDNLLTIKAIKSDICRENVDLFLENSPHLQTMDLSGCDFISNELQEIRKSSPHVTINWAPSGTSLTATTNGPLHLSKKRSGEQTSLDANTAFNPNKEFNVQRIFSSKQGKKKPKISLYRLETFNSFEVSAIPCGIGHAFQLNNTSSDLQLEQPTIIPQKATINEVLDSNHLLFNASEEYYATHSLLLSSDWQALPSFAANETLHHYHLEPQVPVNILYSRRDNLYYIRSKTNSAPIPIQINYSISIPQFSKPIQLPQDILDKINFYSQFKQESLVVTVQNPTGQDYLTALNQQEVGSCRHRTLLFRAWLHDHHPNIPIRIINNDCHSFIELELDGQWNKYNLGGYPAKLVIKEPIKFTSPITTVTQLNTEGISTNTKIYFPLEQQTNASTTAISFLHQVLSNNHPCTLIKAQDSNMIAGLRYHLQKQTQHLSRPSFYVQSAEDLICLAPYIERQADNTGLLKKGPGGRLYNFLTTHESTHLKPLLLINYDAFNASEIVQFNALLDTVRKADSIPLPNDMQIIGLINPDKPGAYNGSDFYSRFDHKETCVLPQEQLTIPTILDEELALEEQSTQRIEFYGSKAWEELLLGHWSLHGKSLQFNEGALSQAIRAQKNHLILSNAPWGLPSFECFWQTAKLTGQVCIYGETIHLPQPFTLNKSQGYSFEFATQIITLTDIHSSVPHVLNPSLMDRFLGEYQCQNGMVYKRRGLIADNQNQSLSIYLSHSLNEAAWYQLLNACQQHQVSLNLTLAPNVTLPASFPLHATTTLMPDAQNWTHVKHAPQTAFIYSTDIDATLAQLPFSPNIVIDVSEVEPADLLTKVTATFDEASLHFQFEEEIGALQKAFQNRQSVILKGYFSDDMQHALVDILYQRLHNNTHPGTSFILISTEPDLFPCVPNYQHTVTLDEKKQILNKSTGVQLEDELIQTKSLAELNAIARYPNASNDITLPWMGMEALAAKPNLSSTPFDLSLAEEKTAAFNQQRLNTVQQALSNSPFVFLAGMSGVGKTSFVQKIWRNIYPAFYTGQNQIKAWACDSSPGIKTLFIDEANISSKQWSEFEGLFNKSPAILIRNEYLPLTSDHKVIFAGNPVNYGGERQMPSFLKRHGNSIVFEPMPAEYIYHEMLKPVLAQSHLHLAEEIARPILNVADFLTSCSQDNVLITPRELVAMSLFTQCHYLPPVQNEPMELSIDDADFTAFLDGLSGLLDEEAMSEQEDESPPENSIAQYYAYILGKNLVPNAFRDAFETEFETSAPNRQFPELIAENFLPTQSNQAAREALNDFLLLRKQRQTQTGNDIQQYGGLGGLIFEGEPGIGKTELVIKTLQSHGLILGDVNHPATQPVFYIIPVSMPYLEKKTALLKAFHEGAVVVMDEINSAPMMEGLLNDLLMGQTPEGKRPDNPGFILIGTQNPITMAGRIKASSALQHRMWSISIPSYDADEMQEIIEHKGLSKNIAQDMVEEYLQRQKNSHKNPSMPKLCFRDLLKRAEQEIRGRCAKSSNKKRALENQENESLEYSTQALSYNSSGYNPTFFDTHDDNQPVLGNNKKPRL